ncbi:hypothetical protein GCM10022245_05370 [Streptomyces mayteni]
MEVPEEDTEGNVVATHGMTVLAFSPVDDLAHVIYTRGDGTAEEYAADLPTLLEGRAP